MFEDKNVSLTPVSDIGEFQLIDKITQGFSLKNSAVKKGPGDDCAVWDKDELYFNLASSDLLAEGVHFDLSYCPLKHLGYKAVAVNVSDICAMNGKAWGILVNIAFSNRFSTEAIEELYNGIRVACENYNITLLGGDTSTSQSGLIISVTVLGEVEKSKITYRSGAQTNDLVCVSGNLGAAFAGLMILKREKEIFLQNSEIQPDLQGFEYVIERQLKPEARIDIIALLEELNIIPSAMIDISDGLSSEILHICNSSGGKGVSLYQDKIPVEMETSAVAETFNQSGHTYGLNGGEDYELLFTLPMKYIDQIKDRKEFTLLGHITDVGSACELVNTSGQSLDIKTTGWNHFKS